MLSIGEFSRISKVTTKTLRYYDEIGLLKPSQVNNDTGYRYYDVEQLKTILFINRLKMYCFSLDEIGRVLEFPDDKQTLLFFMKQKQGLIQDRLNEYEQVLNQLHQDSSKLERGIDVMSYLEDISVKLIEKPLMNILYTRQKMNVEEYGFYMGKLYEEIAKSKLTPLGPPMSIYHGEEFNPEEYDIEIAVPVKEVVKGTRDFEAGLCVSATLNGPYSELASVYAKIKAWIEKEGYTVTGAPFETYLTAPASAPYDKMMTEVCFPVKKQ